MATKVYTVKDARETAESIAATLTGRPGRAADLLAANAGGKDYLGKDLFVVNHQRPDGTVAAAFCKNCMKPGTVLRIPQHWDVQAGAVGVPLGGLCDALNWCDDPYVCVNGTCVNPLGNGCHSDSDCGQGYCGNDGQCHAGARGGPNELNPPGSPCDQSSQCAGSAICKNGICTTPAQVVAGDCASAEVIRRVQQQMIAQGFLAANAPDGASNADGIWGPISQQALDKSGKPYATFAGPCTGPVPHAEVPPTPPPPVKTCSGEGEAPSAALPCCGGLVSTGGGACSAPEPAKKSSWWWWILGGIAVAAGGIGIAYAVGDQPKKGRSARGRNPSGTTMAAYWEGKRVQLHPGTNAWMMGDRYGTVTGVTQKGKLKVLMDKSGRWLELPVDRVSLVEENPSGTPRYRIRDGYAFYFAGTNWETSRDDHWDVEIVDADQHAGDQYVGLRKIDGRTVAVFEGPHGYHAQLERQAYG